MCFTLFYHFVFFYCKFLTLSFLLGVTVLPLSSSDLSFTLLLTVTAISSFSPVLSSVSTGVRAEARRGPPSTGCAYTHALAHCSSVYSTCRTVPYPTDRLGSDEPHRPPVGVVGFGGRTNRSPSARNRSPANETNQKRTWWRSQAHRGGARRRRRHPTLAAVGRGYYSV